MSACGTGTSHTDGETKNLTSGNWLLIEKSIIYPTIPAVYFRGALAPASGSVSGTMTTTGNSCLTTSPFSLSGSITGNTVTLTSASIRSQVMTITGAINSATNFDGTYSKPGGTDTRTCADDSGTVYSTLVPSITGSWSGTLNSYSTGAISITATLDQAAAAADGTFPLSGTVTLNNSPCFTSGTIDSSKSLITGEEVALVATSGGASLTLNAVLANPTMATVMQGGFGGYVTGYNIQGGACGADSGTIGTLNKS